MAEVTRFGRYVVLGVLGRGGFATVYRARDTALGRDVALKALAPHLAEDAEVRRRFVQEAQRIAQLRHPHIVTVHDVGEADGQPFFTMELVEGETLAERGRPVRSPLSWSSASCAISARPWTMCMRPG